MQDIIGAQGKASIFYVKLDDPNNADAVVKEIKSIPGMEQYGVHSLKEYLSLMSSSSIPGLSTFINVVIGISMIIGFIVIFQAMYAAVMERTREIGILKSLGAGKLYIVNVILRETLLISIGGIILGIAMSYAARSALAPEVPDVANSHHAGVAAAGHHHRHHRLDAGSVLPGTEGGTERPHRRAGVRIGHSLKGLLVRTEGQQTAIAILHHKPREFHGPTSDLDVRRTKRSRQDRKSRNRANRRECPEAVR